MSLKTLALFGAVLAGTMAFGSSANAQTTSYYYTPGVITSSYYTPLGTTSYYAPSYSYALPGVYSYSSYYGSPLYSGYYYGPSYYPYSSYYYPYGTGYYYGVGARRWWWR